MLRFLIYELFLQVPSILFAPHHLLACFTVAAETALVLDCSEYESSALPVIEGTPVLWAWHSAPVSNPRVFLLYSLVWI